MSANQNSKKDSKNVKTLFSIVCLCIIALGLIVYFSTNSKAQKGTVNENTTIVDTTEANRAVTAKEPKTQKQTTAASTARTTTAKKEAATMEQGKNNIPYKSFYKYPLTETVLKGYSEEPVFDETLNDYRAHAAVDFTGKQGDKVVAINDGRVIAVYTDSLYGMVVEIDHGGKLVAKYCGLDSVSVKKGLYVNIGNTIGTLGSVPIESKSSPHLHLETKVGGKTVNPLNVMGKTE